MDPQLAQQLRQTITVQHFLGSDEFGNPSYGAPTSYSCRIRDLQKLIETAAGTQAVAAAEVLTTGNVGLQDRVWLPGRDTSDPNAAQTPLNRLTLIDEFGNTVGVRFWL